MWQGKDELELLRWFSKKSSEGTYPGQSYTLIVAPSKHSYLSKSGEIKRQKKEIVTSIEALQLGSIPSKDVFFNFILKDNFSGLFHAESYPFSQIICIESFLYRAMRKKKSVSFYGIPESLNIPLPTLNLYPSLKIFAWKMGIEILHPKSGFKSAIDVVRLWEKEFYNSVNDFDHKTFESIYPRIFHIGDLANKVGTSQRHRFWNLGLEKRKKKMVEPSDQFKEFNSLFQDGFYEGGFENEFHYYFEDSDKATQI